MKKHTEISEMSEYIAFKVIQGKGDSELSTQIEYRIDQLIHELGSPKNNFFKLNIWIGSKRGSPYILSETKSCVHDQCVHYSSKMSNVVNIIDSADTLHGNDTDNNLPPFHQRFDKL